MRQASPSTAVGNSRRRKDRGGGERRALALQRAWCGAVSERVVRQMQHGAQTLAAPLWLGQTQALQYEEGNHVVNFERNAERQRPCYK